MEYVETGTTTTFFRLLIYIILFNTAIMCTGIVLHEWGHYIIGSEVLGCEGDIVLFDTEMYGPHTKFSCPVQSGKWLLYLSPYFLLIPYASLFLLLMGFPERNFFTIMLGFTFFSSALDLRAFSGMEIIYNLFLYGGILIYLAGQYMLVDSTFKRFERNIKG